jgi:hypothetical protein
MDEFTADNQNCMIIRDKHEADLWRVYFQGKLTTPKFLLRSSAFTYLASLRLGHNKPDFAQSRKGTEIR